MERSYNQLAMSMNCATLMTKDKVKKNNNNKIKLKKKKNQNIQEYILYILNKVIRKLTPKSQKLNPKKGLRLPQKK